MKYWLMSFVILAVAFGGSVIGTSATQEISAILVQESENGLEIVNVTANGAATILYTLPNFGFKPESGAEWLIYPDETINTPRELALSPDGQKLAFMAVRNLDTFKVIIYRADTNQLIEKDVEGIFSLDWSPNSSELLMEERAYPTGITYESRLYNVETDTFTSLTHVTEGSSFHWLPNGEQFIYTMNWDLFVTDKTGSFQRKLTTMDTIDLSSLIDARTDMPPRICSAPVWSETNERLYFVVCDDLIDFLYSVDLLGNMQLELVPYNLYPRRYPRSTEITSIVPSKVTSDVYLTIDTSEWDATTSQSVPIGTIQRLTAPEASNAVFERRYSPVGGNHLFMKDLAFSHNEDYMVFSSGRNTRENSYSVTAINVSTGNVLFEKTGLSGVCDVGWLDNETLIYEEAFGLNCPWERLSSHSATVNITTGVETTVSSSPSLVMVPPRYP